MRLGNNFARPLSGTGGITTLLPKGISLRLFYTWSDLLKHFSFRNAPGVNWLFYWIRNGLIPSLDLVEDFDGIVQTTWGEKTAFKTWVMLHFLLLQSALTSDNKRWFTGHRLHKPSPGLDFFIQVSD